MNNLPSRVSIDQPALLEYMERLRKISEGVQTCDICKAAPSEQVMVTITKYGKIDQTLQQTVCFLCIPCQRRVTRILTDLLFAVQY